MLKVKYALPYPISYNSGNPYSCRYEPGTRFYHDNPAKPYLFQKSGVYSAIGLGLGILVHVVYSLAGIGFIIAKSILVFSILKFIGAAYFIYLGYKSLRSKPRTNTDQQSVESQVDMSRLSAVKIGFLTNVFNPKVTLFFLSLFTLVINPATPLWIQVLYGLEMAIATSLWFMVVAFLFSNRALKSKLGKVQHYIEKLTGTVLVFFGIKLALAGSKQ